ncbi:MAG: hypothetical protein R3Y11_09040 [Pseudomonadota bacterium]
MTENIYQARAYFPRGLSQPEGTFRFSIDALLLASFARYPSGKQGPNAKESIKQGVKQSAKKEKPVNMADLGTGCGVVGLAYCLLHEHVMGAGFEIEASLVEAAHSNAQSLGLEERFRVVQADMAQLWAAKNKNAAHGAAKNEDAAHGAAKNENATHGTMIQKASYDIVLSNPPYRLPQSGRAAATLERQQALFETSGTLQDFVGTASKLLRNLGHFNIIYGAARLPDLLIALREAKLEPKRLRMVHSYMDSPARLVLVEAMRGAKPDLIVEPPLILYEPTNKNTHPSTRHYTPEALTFCPFLSCNA